MDYDTSATPGLTRDQAAELLAAADTDRSHRVLRVRRKGGKTQALALPAPAAARIDAYLAGRDDVTALAAVPGPAVVPPSSARPTCGRLHHAILDYLK